MQKIHLLAICAHPDDAELGCAGALLKHQKLGYQTGIVDLTRGELGTQGTPIIREREAEKSKQILKLTVRENVGLPDGFFEIKKETIYKVVAYIRLFQPDIVLTNAPDDRHPDHPRAAKLVEDACFYAGLSKINTAWKGKAQAAWRPKKVYHFVQSRYLQPDFIVDISDEWEKKVESIRAFQSQFFSSKKEQTFISNPEFLKMIEARAKDWGHTIGVQYGEGYTTNTAIGLQDFFAIQ